MGWRLEKTPRNNDYALSRHQAREGIYVLLWNMNKEDMKKTESSWRARLRPAAEKIFAELRAESFTHGEIEAIAGALEQESARHIRAGLMSRWRKARGLNVLEAARELRLTAEDIAAIEDGTLNLGPDAFRPVRQAMRRIRSELRIDD